MAKITPEQITGLDIGSDVQAWDSQLDSLAAIVPGAEGRYIRSDGLGGWEIATSSAIRIDINVENGADVTDETNVTNALDGATLTDVGTPAATDRILLQDASDSNNLKYADFSEFGGGGGGFTPAVFYALGSGSANLGTALGTVPLATATVSDTGYTLTTNEVTIGSDLNGKVAMVTWAVAGNGATNRVEIRSELQVNTVRVKGSSNYTARNGTQNTGGVQGFHILTLSTGDVLRIQALRDGSTANLIADETHLFIQTLE